MASTALIVSDIFVLSRAVLDIFTSAFSPDNDANKNRSDTKLLCNTEP